MFELIKKVEQQYRKHAVVDVRTGDTVRVHQQVKEGNKTRVQVFEGVVIRTDRKDSLTSSITVRRIASGVGVEKTYLLHSPLVVKVEVTKRSKVRCKLRLAYDLHIHVSGDFCHNRCRSNGWLYAITFYDRLNTRITQVITVAVQQDNIVIRLPINPHQCLACSVR